MTSTRDEIGQPYAELVDLPKGEDWKVDDVVKVEPSYATSRNRHVVYRITEIKKGSGGSINYVAMPVDGGRGIKASRTYFVRASDAETARANAAPAVEPLHYGDTVTIAGTNWRDSAGPWVVIDSKTPGKVKVAKLGGADGRHYPGVPRAMITKITAVEAAKMVLAAAKS